MAEYVGTFCAHTAEMLKHLADRDELIKRPPRQPGAPVILKSEIYNFHRLDLMRQVGFTVTVYDEDGLKRPLRTHAQRLPRRLWKLEKS